MRRMGGTLTTVGVRPVGQYPPRDLLLTVPVVSLLLTGRRGVVHTSGREGVECVAEGVGFAQWQRSVKKRRTHIGYGQSDGAWNCVCVTHVGEGASS